MTEPTGVRALDDETDELVDLPCPMVVIVDHNGRKREFRIRMARGSLVKQLDSAEQEVA